MFSIPRYPIAKINDFPASNKLTPMVRLIEVGAFVLEQHGDLVAKLHPDVDKHLKIGTPAQRSWAINQVREERKTMLEDEYWAEFARACEEAMQEPALAYMTWAHDVFAFIRPERGMSRESQTLLLDTLVSVRTALLDIEEATAAELEKANRDNGGVPHKKRAAKLAARRNEDRARTAATRGGSSGKKAAATA